MKWIPFLLLLFLSYSTYGQSIQELQGKWQFVKIEFDGFDAEDMEGEGPADSCMEKNTMEFIDDKLTTTIYFNQDCKESESEIFRFRLDGKKLEFWSDDDQN